MTNVSEVQNGMISDSEASTDDLQHELDETSEEILSTLTDEVILGFCFDVHRAVKLNYFFIDEEKDPEKTFDIVDGVAGADIFGKVQSGEDFECSCPKCGKTLAATRFAPHLEKCIEERGRKSFRKANEKINNNSVEVDYDMDDDSDDWNKKKKKVPRKKRVPNPPKNAKKNKKNSKLLLKDEYETVIPSNGYANPEEIPYEDKRLKLTQETGIILDATKKIYSKSPRGSPYSDEKKRNIRFNLVGYDFIDRRQLSDEVPIDLETVD